MSPRENLHDQPAPTRQEFPHFEHGRPTLSPKNNEVNKLDVASRKPTSQPAISRLNSSPNSLLSGVLAHAVASTFSTDVPRGVSITKD